VSGNGDEGIACGNCLGQIGKTTMEVFPTFRFSFQL
jgi:hypothetical protein